MSSILTIHRAIGLQHRRALPSLFLFLLLTINPAHALYEDFESLPTSQWAVYGGRWGLENGVVIMPHGPGHKAVSGETFSDVEVSARLKVDSGQGAGVIFRVTEPAEGADSFKGYYAYIEPGNDFIGIGKLNHSWTFITGSQVAMTPGDWYDLRVKAIGSNLKVYLDDRLQIEINDEAHTAGAVGVRSWNSDAGLDTFKAVPPIDGVYALWGSDYVGDYTGSAELREENGTYQFVKLVDYTDLTYQSYGISAALEGTASVDNAGTVHIRYPLDLVGFIKQHEGVVRDTDFRNNAPVAMTETLTPLPNGTYEGIYGTVYHGYRFTFHETWTKAANSDEQPLWRNQRVDMPTVNDPSSATLDAVERISDFNEGDYRALPEIAPYADRADFQDKIHFWVHDPTDYDYYQNNPQRLRVIQKVVDPISLTEAMLRNDAYRWKLHEKESHFAQEVQNIQINELGFVSRWRASENRYAHEGDALLWTGVYVAAMAKKYMLTRDLASLVYMLHSLNAVINAIEIVRDHPDDSLENTFARTLMLDRGRTGRDPEWQRGVMNYGPVTEVEYKRGGNNDMVKGIFIAMLWGGKALHTLSAEEYAQVVAYYGDIKARMIRAVLDLRGDHDKLFLSKCRLYEPWDVEKWPNTLHINLILDGLTSDYPDFGYTVEWSKDIRVCYEALESFWDETDMNFMNFAGSISDWSGNHLGIWDLYNHYESFRYLAGEGAGETNKFRDYFKNADEQMPTHHLGFFNLVSGTLRHGYNAQAVEMALWKLKEIPLQRGGYDIDWSINPEFSLSPYPALVWKYDKDNPAGRRQSLRAYPLFESRASGYFWKDNPFDRFAGNVPPGDSGIDFLIAYWFGRYHGVIAPEM